MAPSDRLNQVNKHLNYPAGMLAGQVAIITGAGQGIGAEAARLFANEGAKVVVADIDASMCDIVSDHPEFPFLFCDGRDVLTQRNNPTEKANAVADAINAAESGRALAVVGDVLDGNYITELVKRAAEFGGGKIHIIVNNAGFTWDGVIHKVSELLEFSFFSPFSPGPLVHTH